MERTQTLHQRCQVTKQLLTDTSPFSLSTIPPSLLSSFSVAGPGRFAPSWKRVFAQATGAVNWYSLARQVIVAPNFSSTSLSGNVWAGGRLSLQIDRELCHGNRSWVLQRLSFLISWRQSREIEDIRWTRWPCLPSSSGLPLFCWFSLLSGTVYYDFSNAALLMLCKRLNHDKIDSSKFESWKIRLCGFTAREAVQIGSGIIERHQRYKNNK